MFSFPAQPAGEPSTRNWYQELLDHHDCLGEPIKIQEAYESHRRAALAKSISAVTTTYLTATSSPAPNPNNTSSPPPYFTPDQALLAHLSRLNAATPPSPAHLLTDPLPINCAVIWARPSPPINTLILTLQTRLLALLPPSSIHPIPPSHLHLSVLELAHRHPLPHLQHVYSRIGADRIRTALDLPVSMPTPILLTRPILLFDGAGVAVSFLPDASPGAEGGATYHDLRARMQAVVLESGVEIDTCYTAATAHVTIARFVGVEFFSGEKGAEGAREWVRFVEEVNRELEGMWESVVWRVGEEGLECQMGYVKFGRGRGCAEVVGTAVEA